MTGSEQQWRDVAVLVPCRDEERTVAGVVQAFAAALPGCRVHVCDNGSTDRTAAVAAAAGAVVTSEPLTGKGRALRRLLREVDAEVYVVVDGDGTYDAGAAPALVRAVRTGGCAMAVGTRVRTTADRRGHRLGNALFTGLVRVLFGGGLTDVLSGYRALSRELVQSLRLTSTGFDVEAELTARVLRAGARCVEVPTAYTARPPGSQSKLRTCRDGWRVLGRVVAVRAEPSVRCGQDDPLVHVFLGANAQYLKTAPLLRLMDQQGVPYRLIDSGQHAVLAARVRDELGVRAPDHAVGGATDVDTVLQAVRWSAGLAALLLCPTRLREDVFGGHGGLCVVHGDTPSTLLAALMARRAGLPVVHLEAGLRSHRLLQPFPEEAVRLAVMRCSDLLLAPDAAAERNLRAMHLRGDVVRTSSNTVGEALRHSLGSPPPRPGTGPVVVTMHRVENLHSTARTDRLVDLARAVAATQAVTFVAHGPTVHVLERRGLLARLQEAGVVVQPLQPHAAFTRLLAAAPFVVTDGGSVQEECALLGTPTLLWRERTERPDGLGANVVLSRYDDAVVRAFLADPQRLRVAPAALDDAPSAQVLAALLARLPRRPRALRSVA